MHHCSVIDADASSSDSQPASPSRARAVPAPESAALDSAAAPAADAVQREDWMTKSFPKAADPAALTAAKAAQLKVRSTCTHLLMPA